jgi:hypothetical protein
MIAEGHTKGDMAATTAAKLYLRFDNRAHVRKHRKKTQVSILTSLVLCTKSGSETANADVIIMHMRE